MSVRDAPSPRTPKGPRPREASQAPHPDSPDFGTWRALAAGGKRSAADCLRPLRSLLAGALQQLAEATECSQGCAWLLGEDGQLFVAAELGKPSGRPLDAPERSAWLQLQARTAAVDLHEPGSVSTLRELAERRAVSAAAPVASSSGAPLALLLIGGPLDPPGGVRPQTLAALDEAARNLCVAATTLEVVSRLRQLDDEVQQLDRLAALGRLLAETVHEIRNPLVSIKTFVQLLPEHANDPDFNTRFRGVVTEELQRLERLLDSLMQQASPISSADQSKRASVPATLESVALLLRLRALEREITLTTDVQPELPAVRVKRDALRQVLLNLVINAMDATRPGGNVRLTASQPRGWVEIHVDDDGPGIPVEARAEVFEPFHSTRGDRPGGLGLAISRRIVEEAGGRIAIETSPEGGARFSVRLPAEEQVSR